MSIPLFKVFMDKKVQTEVPKTLMSGMITQSSKVEEFEAQLRKYFNHPYIVTVNSATSALTMALHMAGAKNNEVISSPLTCFATTSAIIASGASSIVWADVDPNTCNIDLEDVKKKISHITKVLVFVHWGGVPVDPHKVNELKLYAKREYKTDLKVVEDCAHAFGAEWQGQKIGTFGNFAAFSFQAIKHLTAGDGGVLLCPDENSYNRARLLRWYGIDRNKRSNSGDFRMEPDIAEAGYKFHMNDINATIGLCNLPNIDAILERCRKNAGMFLKQLSGIRGVKVPNISVKANPSYWIFTIRVLFGEKQEFIKYMKEKKIMVSQVHNRNDINSCVEDFKTELPQLDSLENEIVSIPVGWWVTDDGCKYIIDSCLNFFTKHTIRQIESDDEKAQYVNLLKEMNGFSALKFNFTEKQLSEIYVLMAGNVIVASAKLHIEDKLYDSVGHIEDVVVKESFRGKGYGKEIVSYLTDLSHKNGCYKVVLSCKEDLADFYKKCGLKQSGYSFSSYRTK